LFGNPCLMRYHGVRGSSSGRNTSTTPGCPFPGGLCYLPGSRRVSALMARSHVRLQLGLWRKPGHTEVSKDARLLYVTILGDEALNQAGVVVLRPSVWAEDAAMTETEIDAALHELESRKFVVIDDRSCELLVRTFIRNDGVFSQPNVLRNALAVALQVRSPQLRKVLACELRKLPAPPPARATPNGRVFIYPDPHAVARELDPDGDDPRGQPQNTPSDPLVNGFRDPPQLVNPSRNPSANPSGTAKPQVKDEVAPSEEGEAGTLPGTLGGRYWGRGRGRGRGLVGFDLGLKPSSSKIASRSRPDVDQLCEKLHTRLTANGVRATIGTRWRDAARLLLDRDHRPLPEALELIDWCTSHDFWCTNIHSMPTFRKQYDKLRLQKRNTDVRHLTALPRRDPQSGRIIESWG
jgi:hypothetical protein